MKRGKKATIQAVVGTQQFGVSLASRKKIVIATDAWYPQVNGVVKTLDNTAHELRKIGFEVEFITPNMFSTVPAFLYPGMRLALPRNIGKIIKKFSPDAIYIATEGPIGFFVRKYAMAHAIPFSTGYHTRFPEYLKKIIMFPEWISYRYLRWFHSQSRSVLVPTKSMGLQLTKKGFKNIKVWTRGVDASTFFITEQAKKDALLPVLFPRPIFLNVGRVSREKNLEVFLNLKLPGTKMIVGDGPYKRFLEKKYQHEIAQGNIVFVGEKTGGELALYYSFADVFVFSSKTDTFGIVILEALASGLPIAGYPVTGPIDVVGNSAVGFLHENLQQATEDAHRALVSGDTTPTMCRQYALDHFSWGNTARVFAKYLGLQ